MALSELEQQDIPSEAALLAGAAHDLGNHIAAIQGFSELLLMPDLDLDLDHRRNFSEKINQLSIELLQQFRNLVDFSKIASTGLELDLSTVCMDQLINERLLHFAAQAEKKNIVLHFSSSCHLSLQLDLLRMQQVVDQLLSNAIKFSPCGSRIDVRLFAATEEIVFSVHDQGEGISKEEQAQLFSTLHCLSTKPTEGEFGLGLGLALSKQIVMAHNGVINVRSELAEGACFSVVLPRSTG
ncbi:MAG: HAMP domain-containing sensor histidine kinase [Gammaproteobacteria bacterium]|nr:HAMP domain-containing sensor histidine kinase [Gammaproteobacteria bacterium]